MHLVVLAVVEARSYMHTIYCVTKLVFPYVFFFVSRITSSRTVGLTHIITQIVFFIVYKIYFLLVLSKCSIRSETMCQNVKGLRHL